MQIVKINQGNLDRLMDEMETDAKAGKTLFTFEGVEIPMAVALKVVLICLLKGPDFKEFELQHAESDEEMMLATSRN
jgi:hypothetical protein